MTLSRRMFLAGLGAGLVVGMPVVRAAGAAAAKKAADQAFAPNVFVHIALDGTTTIVCKRSEMGQGVRSSLPVLIADELGADPARIVVQQADGDNQYGDQNTDGSRSVRGGEFEALRKAGAAARMMLAAAAAARWHVKPASVVVANHQVSHPPSKRTLPFAELVAAAAKLPLPKPDAIVLRPLGELAHVASPSLPLVDGDAIVTGKALYGADVTIAGEKILVAVIARPPVVGGGVKKLDSARAMAVPGVVKIVEMPRPTKPWGMQPWGGVAVLAENTWAAIRGRAALDVTWDHGDGASYDWVTSRDEMLASVRAPGTVVRTKGDVDAAFKSAAKIVEAEYVVPHLAHAPMEPIAALAHVTKDTAIVWAPTQAPMEVREHVAKLLGFDEKSVTVHVTLLGGAFGRKAKTDFTAEAVLLSKQVGAPVRVQWTREDDLQQGYYNAANAQRLRAALDGRGMVNAWHHRTALTPIGATFDGKKDTAGADDLQQGVLDVALSAPNVRAEACKAPAHVRVGWYRSVYNIFHAFAIGSFIDELAHARGADPLQTWLDVIGPAKIHSLADLGVATLKNYGESLDTHPVDAGRLRNVLERVAHASGWATRKQTGRALGIAAHRSFVTYTACVISVVPDSQRRLRIDEAWIAIDAGTVINQDRVRSQMEGAVVMGISNALYGGVTHKGGIAEQSNFRDLRIARMRDVPKAIHTEIIASTAAPGGVGEPGVPPVAAALANAIFALTGQRLREIPLAKSLGV